MIFLDETGKRWRRIKLGTGVLGSTVTIPMLLLIAAALLYLPHWGNLNLPKPFSASEPQVKAAESTQVATTFNTGSHRSNPAAPRKGTNSSSTSVSDTSSTSTGPQATTTSTSNEAPVTETTTTTTPPQAESGLANQPEQPGNSDYGRSHQPLVLKTGP